MNVILNSCYEDIKHTITHNDGFRYEIYNEDCGITIAHFEMNHKTQEWEKHSEVSIPHFMTHRIIEIVKTIADEEELFEV